MLATGGGPPKKPDLDPVLQVIEDAASNADIEIVCKWDSTAIFENGVVICIISAIKILFYHLCCRTSAS